MNHLSKFWRGRYKLYVLTVLCTAMLACSGLLAPSGQTESEQARSADSFVDSMGVAVHLNYRDTAYNKYSEIVKPRLQELGVRHIRDGVSLKDTNTQQKFHDLAKIGIKSTLVMDPRGKLTPAKAVKIAKAVADSIEAVEGPNEWDLHPKFQYKGQNFPQGVRDFQAELYSAIKEDPATAHLDVLSPSMGRPKNSSKLGRVDCDIGTMHSYAGGGIPSKDLDTKWIPNTKLLCGNKPIVASECGYHNAIYNKATRHQPGVSEQAGAKYLLRLFLEYFNRGIKRAYTYELIDLKPNPKANRPGFHYGLLRNDGSPKPDFIALKNLIALLQEPKAVKAGLFPLKALDYSLSESTDKVHHTLLQKSDGTLYLILWQEVPSFNWKTKTDIVVPELQVTLTLKTSISQAATYEPLNSITLIKQYTNPKQLRLKIPDHPLVIELVPA